MNSIFLEWCYWVYSVPYFYCINSGSSCCVRKKKKKEKKTIKVNEEQNNSQHEKRFLFLYVKKKTQISITVLNTLL